MAGEPFDPIALAAEIDREIRALPAHGVQPVRAVRRAWSRRLRPAPAETVVAVAMALVDRQRWVAYELLYHHPGGLDQLGVEEVERLGGGDGRLGVGRRLRLLGVGTGLAAGTPPGRGRPPLGRLPRLVLAAGRPGLDGAAQPPIQGRHRRRRAHPRHLPAAGRRRPRPGGQGAVVGAPRAGGLGSRGGAAVPGRSPRRARGPGRR